MIYRTIKNSDYFCMSNRPLRDKKLSLKAKGLMAYFMSCKDDWNFSIDGIATQCADGRGAVNSGLKELIDNGYLDRYSIRVDGRIVDWIYDIYEDPNVEKVRITSVDGLPDVENYNVENEDVENRYNNKY